jgi:ABC-type xylose transport system permease subunit
MLESLVEIAARFLIGGLVVSFFSAVGLAMQPKSFAGIFGAAPAVALASLSLSFVLRGPSYVALEARSMVLGAVALGIYSLLTGWLVVEQRMPGPAVTLGCWLVWLGVAVGGQVLVLH